MEASIERSKYSVNNAVNASSGPPLGGNGNGKLAMHCNIVSIPPPIVHNLGSPCRMIKETPDRKVESWNLPRNPNGVSTACSVPQPRSRMAQPLRPPAASLQHPLSEHCLSLFCHDRVIPFTTIIADSGPKRHIGHVNCGSLLSPKLQLSRWLKDTSFHHPRFVLYQDPCCVDQSSSSSAKPCTRKY